MESAPSSVITKLSSKSVAETVDRLKHFLVVRGFTLFRVIDHSGTAEQVGLQMPDSKFVMFGNPSKGAAVMLAALDLPLKVLVWEDGNGVVSVSYNSPGFMAERYCLDGSVGVDPGRLHGITLEDGKFVLSDELGGRRIRAVMRAGNDHRFDSCRRSRIGPLGC